MVPMESGPRGSLLELEDVTSRRLGSSKLSVSPKDVILYALSVGCRQDDLVHLYEGHPRFQALPTFYFVPVVSALPLLPMATFLPNFQQVNALHAEQYVELSSNSPVSGTFVTQPRFLDVQDKGKGALVIGSTTTYDADTNLDICYSELSLFVLKAGGFRTSGSPAARHPAAAKLHEPPKSPPDAVVIEATTPEQAAIYRLNGDLNPLHIDPAASATAGFPRPILHGACTMGISVKHVLNTFGGGDGKAIKSYKVRFSKPVLPGETLQTEMWIVSQTTVVFQTRVVEHGGLAITNAAVEFHPERLMHPRVKL